MRVSSVARRESGRSAVQRVAGKCAPRHRQQGQIRLTKSLLSALPHRTNSTPRKLRAARRR